MLIGGRQGDAIGNRSTVQRSRHCDVHYLAVFTNREQVKKTNKPEANLFLAAAGRAEHSCHEGSGVPTRTEGGSKSGMTVASLAMAWLARRHGIVPTYRRGAHA